MAGNGDATPLGGHVTSFSERGWQDQRAGLPFPREYDKWDELAQKNYENGRLRAAGAATLWKKIPRRQTPDVVRRVAGLARGFIPPQRG